MKQRLILALGGGGARGFAHIGVLKALEEMGIRPTHITGTSMGAFVGGVYAKTGSAEKTEAAFRELFRWDGFRENAFISTFGKHDESFWTNLKSSVKVLMMKGNFLTKPFYYDGKGFEELIRFFFPENSNFEDLKIPFAAMTTDLITGNSVTITAGKVVPAIVASASITGMMPPVLHKKYLLVDGEVTDLIPVRPFCHHGMNVIIGVDVSKVPAPLPKHPETGLEILIRKDDILQSNYRTVLLKDSDLVIRPAVQDVDWTDYTEFDNLIRVGYMETMRQKIAILAAIKKKRSFINHLKSLWKPETHSWIHEDETEILRWE
ncbi:MAG: patatin-like phospholipase family protein [Bacteroidetes bacterium]|nr:patatin-like phospholipase family protein [Bacteroidota bacterium]